jgi:diaminopimelate decarboxylase
LFVEDVGVAAIAAAVGTPFYGYSSAYFERQYRRFAQAFADRPTLVCFAVKANSNLAVIRHLARLGAGADVVSEGELRRALAAGVPAQRIIFSGVGKSEAEMAFALESGIHQINVESDQELSALSAVATRTGKIATVALRVNPDVDARSHAKISTGRSENKFGIDLAAASASFRRAAALPGIKPLGIAVHIGSQITDLAPFELAFSRVAALVRELRNEGLVVTRLDLGGGLGIRYRDETPPAIEEYAAMVKRVLSGLDLEIAFEQGRWIVGNAGILVSRVVYVKEGATSRFAILDAAMNDLMRHALYDSWHEIVPVRAPPSGFSPQAYDVVGPVCETGDTFARKRLLPAVAAGDLVALLSTGAYGATMGSNYNSRVMAPEILVRGGEFAIVRARQTYEAMLAQERTPPWQ